METSPTMNKRCQQRARPPHQIRSETFLTDTENTGQILLMPKTPDKINIPIFSLQRPTAACPLSHTTRVHCIEVEVQTGVEIKFN